MTGSEKRKALILVALVAAMTVIIAANLRQLQFQPGLPMPELVGDPGASAPISGEPVAAMQANEFIKMLLALMFSCGVLYVLIRVLWSCKWRDVWSYLRQAVVICLVATGLPYLVMLLGKSKVMSAPEIHLPIPPPARTAPLGAAPSVLLWVVGALLLVGAFGLAWWIARPTRQIGTMDLIGLEAQRAWLALKSGSGLKAAIIYCYRQMSQALAEEQGLEREEFMTTGEFEALLAKAGVPCEPIHQLTRLFERVRYGKGQPDPSDEQNALECLEAIMAFCQANPKADDHD